jgi:hypothetical protein
MAPVEEATSANDLNMLKENGGAVNNTTTPNMDKEDEEATSGASAPLIVITRGVEALQGSKEMKKEDTQNARALDINKGPEQDGTKENMEEEKEEVATNDDVVEELSREGVEVSDNKLKKGKGWKRKERVHYEYKKVALPVHKEDVQQHGTGRVRPRPEENNEENMWICSKRGLFQPPSLSECLGKEGLRQLREEEMKRMEMLKMKEGGNMVKERKEATGLGAAGLLPGADGGARQAT